MPSDNPSQEIAEISKRIEFLSNQSLSRSDRAADISEKVLGYLSVSLEWITALAGG
jgi:hypothetical protein